MFAVERDGIEPDILTLAKSLGGGLIPLGAMITRRDLWMKAYGSYQTFALHSSTFSGGSLRVRRGLGDSPRLRDGSVLADAAAAASSSAMVSRRSPAPRPIIREIRGHGLMLGVEFCELPTAPLANFKGFSPSRREPVGSARSRRSLKDDPRALRSIQSAPRTRDLHSGRPLQPPAY